MAIIYIILSSYFYILSTNFINFLLIKHSLMTSHTSPSPLVLVDGSSYLYRAFHALPPLTNSKGQPTGAIYGMINMLKRLMADYQPVHMVVVFDAKGKTFRNELYEAYKATRQQMPEELIQQIAPLHRIIAALGIPILMIDRVEADDVIGTLVKQSSQEKIKTLISTGDKDLTQLVDEHTTLINTMTNKIMDREGVKEKFGVWPEQMVDYLTLVGDSSDNIPGVPQVGPKTAVKWLAQYGSLDNLIQQSAQLTGKVGDNFRNTIKDLPLIKSLVTIKSDVVLDVSITSLNIKSPDQEALIELFKDLEFKNWLAELLKTQNNLQIAANPTHDYQAITSKKVLTQLVNELSQASLIAMDIETTGLDYLEAELVGFSFAVKPYHAVYLPFGHDQENEIIQLSKEEVLTQLKPIFENPLIKKIGQNIKFDIEVLARENIQLKGVEFDTMIEAYVLDSANNQRNLDALALKHLGHRTITFAELAGTGSKQLTFNQIPIEKALPYAAEDADLALRLHDTLWPHIANAPGIQTIFKDIEMPLVPVLARMEQIGVLIDAKKLEKQTLELTQLLLEKEKAAFALAGQSFNLNSPKQLQEILFQQLKLPVLQKTPTGQASTADSVLQELAQNYPLPGIIIEYRSFSKLISTYTSRLPEQIHPKTQRIHTSYNQTGTATGRLSSSDPNLQNIPIRTPEGRRIRQAFIAPIGFKILSADYSQIELRLMAHMSGDENLLRAFANHQDIHEATAAEVWHVPITDVTFEMRRQAKAINFGLIYGMSAFGLTRQLGIERKAAQAYIDRYFERYPGVKNYIDNTRMGAKEKGYVETLWGRRLYVPDINAKQIPRQKAAERMAINAPLQGSAADIIKMAMIAIDHWLQQENIPAKMIMQVHDELVFEVAEKESLKIAEKISHYMSTIVHLHVPLLVSMGMGDNWDEASKN
jgi:DNA polymerase-1